MFEMFKIKKNSISTSAKSNVVSLDLLKRRREERLIKKYNVKKEKIGKFL